MYSSADRDATMRDAWFSSVSVAVEGVFNLQDSDFAHQQLYSTLWSVISQSRMNDFWDELFSNDQIFIEDEWFIDLPQLLIDEQKQRNSIRIYTAGNESYISVKEFCLSIKLAMIFASTHLDAASDPWSYFVKLDQFCEKYI